MFIIILYYFFPTVAIFFGSTWIISSDYYDPNSQPKSLALKIPASLASRNGQERIVPIMVYRLRFPGRIPGIDKRKSSTSPCI